MIITVVLVSPTPHGTGRKSTHRFKGTHTHTHNFRGFDWHMQHKQLTSHTHIWLRKRTLSPDWQRNVLLGILQMSEGQCSQMQPGTWEITFYQHTNEHCFIVNRARWQNTNHGWDDSKMAVTLNCGSPVWSVCVCVCPCTLLCVFAFVIPSAALCVCVCVVDVCRLQCCWIWKENNQIWRHWRSLVFILSADQRLEIKLKWLQDKTCY